LVFEVFSRIRVVLLQARDVDEDSTGHSTLVENFAKLATVLRDTTNWLSNIRTLRSTDVIILLTPVVIPISPDPVDVSDPFEPLGRSLAKRHARIRHVPYTQRFE
jgi:hypothetical protein